MIKEDTYREAEIFTKKGVASKPGAIKRSTK